ncbi:MAG: CBS domain-containing protein [Alphaproteobacteria bacterium]|nr:CBS domain-containing protein [Alphaproteobacteria bacterium]
MFPTRVKDLMREDPVIIPSNLTLEEAAQKMEAINCGVLPVGTDDKIEGIITDRDIVIRAVAKGKDITKERVRDHMTAQVCSCQQDDTPDRAAGLMRENNVNRVIVEDEDGRPCGILTFGHIIRKNDSMTEIATAIECAVGRKAA